MRPTVIRLARNHFLWDMSKNNVFKVFFHDNFTFDDIWLQLQIVGWHMTSSVIQMQTGQCGPQSKNTTESHDTPQRSSS